MKRIMIACGALAALAVPALAGAPAPKNVPDNGTFGTDRAVWAGVDPLFGATIAARQGSNSIDNHLWMLNVDGKTTGKALDSNNPNLCTPGMPGC
jgi:hypothetical protein